jgi:hypothetical protein
MMETFIDRSCSHPLSIVIDVGDDIMDDLYPQLNLVVPLISRWRSLFIHGSFYEDISDVCGLFGELCAPLLETFEVVNNSEEGRENYVDDHLQVFTAGAPRLSYVRIQGVSLGLPPLTSLVSLRLHFPPKPLARNQFVRLLTASHQLRNLHISGDVLDIHFLSSSPAIEIPSLRSLVVVPTVDTDLSSLLIFLECPALEHLTVGSITTHDILPVLENSFRTINGPSRYPFLQSLTLRHVKFGNWWEANWAVIMLPSITHIVIDSCINPEILLDRLLPRKSLKWAGESDADELDAGELDEDSDGCGSVYWPLLQTITLSTMTPIKLKVLYRVISDRISRGIPLTCIRLGLMRISAERLEWLHARVRIETIEGQVLSSRYSTHAVSFCLLQNLHLGHG